MNAQFFQQSVNEQNFFDAIRQSNEYTSKYNNRDYSTPTAKSSEDKLLNTLTAAVKRKRPVADCLDYLYKQLTDMGAKPGESRQHSFNMLVNKDLQTIFNPENDENWFNCFINDITLELLANPSVLVYKSKYIDGINKDTSYSIPQYVAKQLDLDEENKIHKLFLTLVTKFDNYYKNNPQQEISETPAEQLSEAEMYLKQELLDEPVEALKESFEVSVEDLIEYSIYHTHGVENAAQILEAVKMVVDNGETLSELGLTPTNNWIKIIYTKYGIEYVDNEPDIINPVDEEDFPVWENQVDVFDTKTIAQERLEEVSGNQRKDAAKKAVTLINKLSGETHEFDSCNAAMEFLNVPKRTFERLKKGETKLAKQWTIEMK